MITNTTAKSTYVVVSGVTEYAVGFVYQTNPDGSPQLKVYVNDLVNTPLVYGADYTMSQDGTKVIIASGAEVGDSLTIIRNIPIVQLSDYVVGRIDPEQIENDFDLCVERDQQQSARITVTEEQLAAHDERISAIEEVVPESATTDNLLATVSDIPTDLAQLTNSPGYITGITSSDVTTALGYTPYDASNPNGYTTNTGTVTSVNNIQPVNGNVTLEIPVAQQSDWAQSDNTKVDYIKNKPTIPTVNNATITITQGGVTKGSFTLNQGSSDTIALDAGGGDLPSQTGNAGKFLTTDGTDASWSDKPLVNTATGTNSLTIGSSIAGMFKSAINIGGISQAYNYSVAIGYSSISATGGVAIGYDARISGDFGVAVGRGANVGADRAIQIGSGMNQDTNTFKVSNANGNFEMMSADGTIPAARHAVLPAADGTYTLQLVITNGEPTLSWVAV